MRVDTTNTKPHREHTRDSETDHFAHREADGIVVDLFWSRGGLGNEFRVEVEDRREGTSFVLHATTGREAMEAFRHPFSTARIEFDGEPLAA